MPGPGDGAVVSRISRSAGRAGRWRCRAIRSEALGRVLDDSENRDSPGRHPMKPTNHKTARAAASCAGGARRASRAAHVAAGTGGGFLTGLHHPVSGLDHVLAMIAVGLWGAQLGAPAMLAPAGHLPAWSWHWAALMGLLGVRCPASRSASPLSAILLGGRWSPLSAPAAGVAAVIVGFLRHLPRPRARHRVAGRPERLALQHGLRHGYRLPARVGISIGLIHRWGRPDACALPPPVPRLPSPVSASCGERSREPVRTRSHGASSPPIPRCPRRRAHPDQPGSARSTTASRTCSCRSTTCCPRSPSRCWPA